MLYREAGDFKTTYIADMQTFPIRGERILFWLFVAFCFGVVPFLITGYWEKSILVPFLVWSMIALGLNILTGYCGQVSLGTGGFMAVGAFACYKLTTAFPELNIVLVIILSGAVTAGVGMLFGLPSLRIKGFYLAVATLAAQFFLVWCFNKFGWFYNYSASGQISMPTRTLFGVAVTGPDAPPWATYLVSLTFVFVFAWVARNLTRGRLGRSWMAMRDMDIAAQIMGISPFNAKLSAFAISSFYVGMGGAMFFAIYLGAAEVTEAFGIDKSFDALFMIIIGGLGSILGSFLGAAFIVVFPVFLKNVMVGGLGWSTDLAAHVEIMTVGALIIFFLIVEPHGLAQIWRLTKEKLRLWPFPY
jgi:branched-chain amino acid transport system permease protein